MEVTNSKNYIQVTIKDSTAFLGSYIHSFLISRKLQKMKISLKNFLHSHAFLIL